MTFVPTGEDVTYSPPFKRTQPKIDGRVGGQEVSVADW